VLTRENEMDVLTVQVEARPELAHDQHAAVMRKVETEIVSRCELRPEIEVLTYGTLPKTEFKAKRLKDLR
jgi:phenylacetate-CoA ligase